MFDRKSATGPTIDVQQLRVGMFVHLDLGWMSHPFPLSSFRISSPEQIATIRSLGLRRVRWAPDKSELLDVPAPEAWPDGGTGTANGTAAGMPAETPEEAAARLRRELLERQRAAAQHCERQYAQAARAWRAAHDAVATQPEQARQQTEALTRSLVDQLMTEGEMCVRLLTGQVGDRATAHALNVAVISLLMGRTFGLPADEMMDLGTGALLHDVGKIELPDRLRHADERFTQVEANAYQEHVALGVALGRRMALAPGALLVLAQHHENADGTGFPMRLNVDRMTMAARIVSIVNRYDNLCNPPLLARALTPHEAVALMFAQSRDKYDRTVLNAFIKMMGVYPAGSVVQLTDDRYAMVVGVNSTRPLKPRVLVHDPAVPRGEALLVNLEELPDLGIRRSLPAAKLPPAALEYLSPRPRVSYFFEPQTVFAGAEETVA